MIKILAKSIREYKKPALLTPVYVSLEVIMECIIPFLIARLVNKMNAGCGLDVIIEYGAGLVVIAALSLLFGALAGSTCAVASCGLAKNLRQDIFHSIQTFSFENIDKFSVSSLVTRLTTDITNVQNAYMMIIRSAIRAPLMVIFAFTMALIMGGRLAWIFLFVMPVLLAGLLAIVMKAMPLFKKVFKKYDVLNASVQENIQGMRVVKSFVREEYEQKKFDTAAEDVCKDFTKAERILVMNNPLMQFCLYVVMIFILQFGAYTIITTKGLDLDVGQLSSLLSYGFMMLSSLMMLSIVFVMITMAVESGKRITEILTEKSTLTNPENPIYEVADGSISFEHVSFKYSLKAQRMVLEDIDLQIASGETIGIIGGTGSSKSKILILDDSTSAVDTKTDARIRKALREYIPETTKIIIVQRTASVEDADRIIVMEGGRIHAIGTHAELLEKNDIYREIYTSQNKAGANDGK